MSLYGTGRREGILAACLIAILAAGIHLSSALLLGTISHDNGLTTAAGSIGGILIYRFLRVQGRSRYAAFLGGVAYGLSPLFTGLLDSPREVLAATLAPLSLEAAYHCNRPSTRSYWLPWTGLSLALPFIAGITVIATLAASISLGLLAIAIIRRTRCIDELSTRGIVFAIAIGCVAIANIVWLDPISGWLGNQSVSLPQSDISSASLPLVMICVTGPFLTWFALLGMMRRQRNVSTSLWLILAALGALPSILTTYPGISLSLPYVDIAWATPAISWWLSIVAITVMGTAGLDDWFDHPQRTKHSHEWLFLATMIVIAAFPLSNTPVDSIQLAMILGTTFLVALMPLLWRQLGVLRFKTALTFTALLTFSAPAILQRAPIDAAASPLGETASPSFSPTACQLMELPYWHFTGLAVAFMAAIGLTLTNIWSRPKPAN
jgi:hypothetical protein